MRRAVGIASIVSLLALALGAPASVTAIGFDFLYPSAQTHCTSGDPLQDCIDAAGVGGKVEIDTNTQIDLSGSVLISSSFTLTSASGYHGYLKGAINVRPTSGTANVTVSNLRINGLLTFLATGGSGHRIVFDRDQVSAGDVMGGAIDVNTHVPADVTVRRSTASVVSQVYGPIGISFYVDIPNGLVTLRAIGNVVTGHGSTHSSTGIGLTRYGGGTLLANFDNNSVWDIAQNGFGAGLGLYIASTGGNLINLAGDTVDRSGGNGIYLQSQMSGGGMVFSLFNSLVSHATLHGVQINRINGTKNFVVQGGDNDFYANGPNSITGYSLGKSLALAPTYVDAPTGNLRLKAASPLIDQGVICSPAGVAIPDAAGLNRLAGKSVDIGAYENGAGTAKGIAVVGTAQADTINGTAADDILCGMDGADKIRGLGGADYINGGTGPDVISGGTGPDRLFGGPDADVLCASDGTADLVNGGTGTDHYVADPHDTLVSAEVSQAQCPIAP